MQAVFNFLSNLNDIGACILSKFFFVYFFALLQKTIEILHLFFFFLLATFLIRACKGDLLLLLCVYFSFGVLCTVGGSKPVITVGKEFLFGQESWI